MLPESYEDALKIPKFDGVDMYEWSEFEPSTHPPIPPPALLCAWFFISTAAQVSQAHKAAQVSQAHKAAPHEYHRPQGDPA